MTNAIRNLDALSRAIRASFSRLRALGDALHADLGITASMRAVMESLAERGAQTVPQIARAKGVSRQHIQVNVDALIEAGLVAVNSNPEHKRSSLLDLSKAGRRAFDKMRRREAEILRDLVRRVPRADVAIALRTLQVFNAALVSATPKGTDHA